MLVVECLTTELTRLFACFPGGCETDGFVDLHFILTCKEFKHILLLFVGFLWRGGEFGKKV